MSLIHVHRGVGSVRPYLHGPTDLPEFLKKTFDAVVLESNDDGPTLLQIGDSFVWVEAGELPSHVTPWVGSVYVYVADVDAVHARAIERGARSISAPQDKPYNERQAGFVDAGGNTWWVSTHLGTMNAEIRAYNARQAFVDKAVCDLLATTIDGNLTGAEGRLWHAHPVWFLEGNPIAGYSKQKAGWRLMFWSGASFEEDKLNVIGRKFKDASIFYTAVEQIDTQDIERWLRKSAAIQWDYKNVVKRKGQLVRLK